MMRWMIFALTMVVLAFSGPVAAKAYFGGGWMLEATIPLPQVCAVAVSPDSSRWAAASPYQSWLFEGQQLVARGPLRARTGLQLLDGGRRLAAFGDEWGPGSEYAVASMPKQTLSPEYVLASSLILPGGNLMAAYVMPSRSKGDLDLAKPGEELQSNKLLLLDCKTGRTIFTLSEGYLWAEELEILAFGQVLACAHERLQAFNLETGGVLVDLPIPHTGMGQKLAVSPDASMMVLADPHSGKAAILDLNSWRYRWTGQLAGSGIRHLAFGQSSNELFFASKRGGLYHCNIHPDSGPSKMVSLLQAEVLDFALDPKENRIYCVGNDCVKILLREM